MSNFKKTHIPKFRRFVIQNFPFIEEDFDALTDYALMCKIVEFLNAVIESTNESSAQVEELTDLYNELKAYVDSYFDNLDVQEEINNKLDQMASNGTLYALINNEIFRDLNNQVIQNTLDINTHTEQLENKVGKNEADSVSMDMLTQEVLEALTGGSTAVVGENSVGTVNLKDKAVTVFKLDDNLQDNFTINYTRKSLGNATGGFYSVSGSGKLVYNNGANVLTDYACYQVSLTKGKYYRFDGYNYSSTLKGIIIGTDVGEDVIVSSTSGYELKDETYTGVLRNIYATSLFFYCNADNLVAFISGFSNDKVNSNLGYPGAIQDGRGIWEVSGVEVIAKEIPHTTLQIIEPYATSAENRCVTPGDRNNPTAYGYSTLNGYQCKFYEFKKGIKYNVVGTDRYACAGFLLFDKSWKCIYSSSNEYQSQAHSFEYEFTATDDCFGIGSYGYGVTCTVKEYVATTGETTSRLAGKTILYNGDSITESRTGASANNGGAYPKIISDLTDSYYTNYAVGGGTLAYVSNSRHVICRDITNMSGTADCVIFSGGINDYWKHIPLGSYTESDFTGSVDDTTICGALESIFRQAINKWVGVPILFVITHKIKDTVYNNNTAGYCWLDVYDKIKGICNKYGIPYYDCFGEGILNGYIDVLNNNYLTAGASGSPDGCHPNEAGYQRYYVPQVIKLIEDNLKY
jgi:lysophospholipase L1-like esterase